MKKWLAVFVVFAMILVVAVACHSGGGNNKGVTSTTNPNEPVVPPSGPGPNPATPPIVFSNPTQAAQATAALAGTQVLASAQFDVVKALGLDSQRRTGFAPSLATSGDIGNIDPGVAAIMQTMKNFVNSASIQMAVKKAGALRAEAMRAIIPPPGTTLTTQACNQEGQAVITGSNTYDDFTNPNVNSAYDIVFTNCKDSGTMTQLDGTMHIEQLASINNDAVAVTVVVDPAAPLKQITFVAPDFVTPTVTSVMTGTFINDDQITKIQDFADGTFTVTTAATGTVPEKVATFNYQGLEKTMTLTHNSDGSNTTTTVTKGTFKVSSASGGTPTLDLSLALNLTDETIDFNNPNSLILSNNTTNGSVDMIFASLPATAACLSGKLSISTTAPREFTTAGGTCPQNGTVQVNTAIINYEPNAPIQIAVNNGAPETFADCAALDAAGGACTF